jgi:PLD-like domain
MQKATARAFLSPTLVLLAMDWEDGAQRNDFLGFAIKRTPGFRDKQGAKTNAFDWLPNRLGFHGPNPDGTDMPSITNPIQHFEWWDARINTEDRGKSFTYTVYPVAGSESHYGLVEDAAIDVVCKIPMVEEQGIGTYFNRAVVSSQAFAREFGHMTTHADYEKALAWLSNGMNTAIQNFLTKASTKQLAGAAYHLTDNEWTVPALQKRSKPTSFIYFFKKADSKGKNGDNANAATIKTLKPNKSIKFYIRTRTSIMHDKYMVRTKGDKEGQAEAVLTGTANFTTEGLTQQANVIHTFESPELANLYLERQILLRDDPTVGETADGAKWSPKVQIGDATIRVFFAPERPAADKKKGTPGSRQSIGAVVKAVKGAQSSVMFSLFSATDKDLMDACTAVAGKKKLMRGLVNSISKTDPRAKAKKETASTVAATWLYETSKDDHMVVGHDSFGKNNTPTGFWQESNVLVDPTKKQPKAAKGKKGFQVPNVYVHQKIVIVDGDTDNPTIYVGSANLSGNSTWNNDENMLEITDCPRLAKAYVAEFMRLYEQYRARFSWNRRQHDKKDDTFTLTTDARWAKKDYTKGTMEYIARLAFAGVEHPEPA